jgi:hypothetical protein
MMHDGPWTTRLYISDAADPHYCIFIEARDLGNGGVDYEWLSEKLLFVRCWWGRIVSTDFVLDTGTARPIYIEDANYSKLVYGEMSGPAPPNHKRIESTEAKRSVESIRC